MPADTRRLSAAVVADDLTGAADTGVQLARAGYRTAVAFHGASPETDGLDAIVADTDSRALAPEVARARVRAATHELAGARIVFKKVDSTLRGPVGAEVVAALAASGRRRAIVAPAFPATGRTTAGGIQLVGGRRVDRSEFATDPVAPAREAHLPTLLSAEGLDAVVVVPAGDRPAAAAALRRARCVVADARTDADLEALVRAAPDPSMVLWVGSGGLAKALAAVHPGPGAPAPAGHGSPAGTLVVAGSPHAAAQEQLRRLLAHGVPAAPLALAVPGETAVAACVEDARRALRTGRACVVHPAGTAAGRGAPARIAEALAEAAARLADEGLVTGLVLTGGDTAVRVARRLGATGLRVDDELEPGVPIGRLLGPRPYPVVTKAGGFGSPDVLATACATLTAA